MIRAIAAAAAACAFCSAAQAVDGVAIEVGRGDDRTNLLRLALTDQWRKRTTPIPEWRLAGYWELSAGAWDNHDESTADIGLTPVFRIERSRLYLEAAIGLHLVQARISAHRTFSTALQFGDHLGAGFYAGKKYDFGVRVQHLSNGGIAKPNPGVNFLLVRLQYALE
jgi:lipid A 3-O-deacylase